MRKFVGWSCVMGCFSISSVREGCQPMDNWIVNTLASFVDRAVFPRTCVLCGQSARALDICEACTEDLPLNSQACNLCAQPLPADVPGVLLCGKCLRRPPKHQGAFCPYRYSYPIDHLVRAFKFHQQLTYGRVIGELLSTAVQRRGDVRLPTVLLPVPLAAARFKARGFNQAIELGRVLEKRLGIPLCTDVIVRTRATAEQAGLDRVARRKNVRKAFSVIAPLPAKHVAIVDDVITTGSTMNELARVLKRAGAERIEAWAVARTAR
jgi:ComF family protein